jgi:hypothetical protein
VSLFSRWLLGVVDDDVRAALMLALAGAAISLSSRTSAAESSADRRTADPVPTNARIKNLGIQLQALAFKNRGE